ncbi:hypothetical protein CGRA01v4_10736 [Colletotrichum graminicola]|nr:hypothetical protein CGRA01v4_10736 [Colletotrichum graminicola]
MSSPYLTHVSFFFAVLPSPGVKYCVPPRNHWPSFSHSICIGDTRESTIDHELMSGCFLYDRSQMLRLIRNIQGP